MASRFLVPGGTGNYSSTSNWSSTTGGATGASVPTSADDIVINSLSVNTPLIIDTNSQCRSFICSGYTGTVTLNNNLDIVGTAALGNITLSSGMTLTGSATMSKTPNITTGVITSNGVTFSCNFAFNPSAASTTTLTGNMVVTGNVSIPLNSTSITTLNSGSLSIGGTLTHLCPLTGTSVINFIGNTTATILQGSSRTLSNNIVFNKTGIMNIADFYYSITTGRTITYTAGVINHTGTLYIPISTTFNTNGMAWNIIMCTGVASITLTSTSNISAVSIVGTGRTMTFAGTSGFTVNNLLIPINIASPIITFTAGRTYTINSSLIVIGRTTNLTFGPTLRSVTAYAIIILGQNAICRIACANITNIDASQGKTIRVLNNDYSDYGQTTITTSRNVYILNNLIQQKNSTF